MIHRITLPSGQPAPRHAGTWLLDEARSYHLRVEGPPCSATLDGRPLPFDPTREVFPLHLPFAVGTLQLHLQGPASPATRVQLQVRPAAHKLPPEVWMDLLADLEAWLPGLTTGAEGPRQGHVGTVGVSSPLLAEALLPLLPALERAVLQVLDQPRQRSQDHLHTIPLHQTRAADRETVAWLVRHPREAGWLHPVRSLELSGQPPHIPQRSTTDTLDHPANRHVAWLLQRVVRRLRETAAALDTYTGSKISDDGAWARSRARALRTAADRLDRQRKRSFLRALKPHPASEGAMLVVLDHPAYARVHRLARRILSARFSLEAGDGAATRPSFELYELWCLLRIQRALAGLAWTAGMKWRWTQQSALLSLNGSGTGAAAVGTRKSDDTELRLEFNPTFPGWFAWRKTASEGSRHSLSSERRPDLVLGLRRGTKACWLVFDAKYRVGAANLGAALESVHIYRDALRWPDQGGAPLAAFLLSPRSTADAADWFSAAFHRSHHMGVLALCPGRPITPATHAALTRVWEAVCP